VSATNRNVSSLFMQVVTDMSVGLRSHGKPFQMTGREHEQR